MTYKTPIHLYIKILQLIDYEGDVEQFLENEEYMNYVETSMDLFDTLEKEQQGELRTLLENNDLNKLKIFYKEHYGEERFSEELKNVTENSIRKLIRDILPHLKPDKIRQLDAILGSQIAY